MYTHIRKHIHASIHTDIHIYVHTCRSGSWNNWLLGDPEALNISRIPPGPRPVSTLQYIVLVQYSTTSLQSKPAHPETPQSLLAHLGRQRENAVLENRSLSYSSLSLALSFCLLCIYANYTSWRHVQLQPPGVNSPKPISQGSLNQPALQKTLPGRCWPWSAVSRVPEEAAQRDYLKTLRIIFRDLQCSIRFGFRCSHEPIAYLVPRSLASIRLCHDVAANCRS